MRFKSAATTTTRSAIAFTVAASSAGRAPVSWIRRKLASVPARIRAGSTSVLTLRVFMSCRAASAGVLSTKSTACPRATNPRGGLQLNPRSFPTGSARESVWTTRPPFTRVKVRPSRSTV